MEDHEHRATRHDREGRNRSLQERTEGVPDSFGQTIGNCQEQGDVMTESPSNAKGPPPTFIRT
jgi:hypothetical protein